MAPFEKLRQAVEDYATEVGLHLPEEPGTENLPTEMFGIIIADLLEISGDQYKLSPAAVLKMGKATFQDRGQR